MIGVLMERADSEEAREKAKEKERNREAKERDEKARYKATHSLGHRIAVRVLSFLIMAGVLVCVWAFLVIAFASS